MSPAARRFILENRVFRPNMLPNLATWYDISDLSSMLNNAGAVPSSGDSIKLVSDKSGNSATNCLVLNGVSGNSATTPDNAAFGGATELDVRVWVEPSDVTVTNREYFAQYWSAGNKRAWTLTALTPAKTASLYLSNDGTTGVGVQATTALTISNYLGYGLRATWRASDGRVQFFTRTDIAGIELSTGWTQLGTDLTIAIASLYDSDQAIYIGGKQDQSTNYPGNFIYADARVAIDGARTICFDSRVGTKLASTVTGVTGETWTINTSGATGARISGARDIFQGTAAFQPIYLPWSGTNYGYLNGVAGNYFSTPDSAAVSITGDIDLKWYGAAADWTPASIPCLVSKYAAAGTRSYLLQLDTTGVLTFTVSVDGTAVVNANSTAAPTVSNGAYLWLRVTRQASSGDVKFYTGGSGETPTWVQLGTTVSTAASAIFDSAAALAIGMRGDGITGPLNGNIGRVQIYDGYDGAGTLVFDFNPSAYSSGKTFLDSAGGATITLNGGSTIVTRTCLYLDGSNDYLKAAAFSLSQPWTGYTAGSFVSYTDQDAYWDGHSFASSLLFQRAVANSLGINAGASVGNVTLVPGRTAAISAVYNGAASSIRLDRETPVTGDAGSTAANGFTLGARGGATNPSNITVSEVLVYAAAHTTAQQDSVILYEGRKWSIALP